VTAIAGVLAPQEKGTRIKLSVRCDFSRYGTVAVSESRGVSESRHSSLGLFLFLKTVAVSESRSVSESRHSSLGLFLFLKTEECVCD
jgi:hypothetical protein